MTMQVDTFINMNGYNFWSTYYDPGGNRRSNSGFSSYNGTLSGSAFERGASVKKCNSRKFKTGNEWLLNAKKKTNKAK